MLYLYRMTHRREAIAQAISIIDLHEKARTLDDDDVYLIEDERGNAKESGIVYQGEIIETEGYADYV